MNLYDASEHSRLDMKRRALIVAGVFVAVAGFGATRWVQAELDLMGSDASMARYNSWVNGPIDRNEVGITMNGFVVGQVGGGPERGVPRRVIAGIGWGAASVGCAMVALGLVLPRGASGLSRSARTPAAADFENRYSPEE